MIHRLLKWSTMGFCPRLFGPCTPAHNENFYGVFFDQTSVIDVHVELIFSILNDAHANCTSNLMTESYLASMFNIATSYTLYACTPPA